VANSALTPSRSRGLAPVEKIEEPGIGTVDVTDQEVRRHPHADQRHPDAPPDLDHQHRQRDRDPLPPGDHLVDARVAPRPVRRPVPAEPEVVDEVRSDPLGRGGGAVAGEDVEQRQALDLVDDGLQRRGDRDRRPVERHVRSVIAHQLGESGLTHRCTVPVDYVPPACTPVLISRSTPTGRR
jgi:hypothetical protein